MQCLLDGAVFPLKRQSGYTARFSFAPGCPDGEIDQIDIPAATSWGNLNKGAQLHVRQ